MTKEQYVEKMKHHEEEFDKMWDLIVEDTNVFVKDNPSIGMYSFSNNVEKFVDNLCLSGAWIHDRIENVIGFPGMKTYKRSLSKKIRKALGYTL